MNIKECDNKSRCHSPVTIAEDGNAMRVICCLCWRQYVIKKDWRGVPDNRQYSKIFRGDILQGNDNLLYKLHPEFLKT